uniref:Putative ovule protein n=1 Tax=Solanum chacoense TaxID=4108 RepID=A0A0V0HBN1_SOLCH
MQTFHPCCLLSSCSMGYLVALKSDINLNLCLTQILVQYIKKLLPGLKSCISVGTCVCRKGAC